LIRTAPAIFRTEGWRAEHWFDGLGMLYEFALEPGRVRYLQRALESRVARQAREGRVRTTSFASPNQRSWWQRWMEPIPRVTDNANVNVVRMGGEWVAMTESPHQLSIDEETLTVRGRVAYEDALPKAMGMIAHPHHDLGRGQIVNLGMTMGRRAEIIAYTHAPESRARQEVARVSLPELPYVHSFGLTREHVVVVGHPFSVRPLSLLWSNRGYIEHFRWRPERGTTLYLMNRSGGPPRRFETDAFFSFHTVNAFEEDGEVVLDLMAYDDAHVIDALRVAPMTEALHVRWPRLLRLRMLPDGKTRAEVLSQDRFEFPAINYRKASGARQRFVWGAAPEGNGADVLRVDCETGATCRFGLSGYRFGEPVFVGRPGALAEDDGVLLTTGSSERACVLAVLDAATLQPHALVHAEVPIPLGFHGSFARS